MPHRFYAVFDAGDSLVELSGAEAHHLLHVLRLGVADEVLLFDGRGNQATATVESTSRGAAMLRIMAVTADAPDRGPSIVLASAVPKGDRWGWLVEKATELGVERLVPLTTAHSVVHPGAAKLDRTRQTVIAACKQSGRSSLMLLDELTNWADFVAREFSQRRGVVSDRTGLPWGEVSDSLAGVPLVLAVGPEGGFNPEEINVARQAGAVFVNLGELTLRIETAALVLATLCRLAGMK